MSQRYDIHTLSVQMTVAPTTVTTVLDPDSYDKGYNAGETEGHKNGKAEGYTEGHGVGYMEGHNEGFVAGETSGYQSGKSDGYSEGYGKGHTEGLAQGEQNGYSFGFDEGKKAEYDAFWDSYQQSGKRISYDFAFAGAGWNDNTFKPKYDIIPSWNIVNMFYKSQITNLDAILKECNVILDISENGNYGEVFNGSAVTVLPELEYGASAWSVWRTFADCTALHTIRKLTFNEAIDSSRNFNDIFANDTSLANVDFAGVLKGNINCQWCPLTRASIESLFSILSDTASGKTVTLNKVAKEAAFTATEWTALIATKSNWTISLI